MTSSTWMHNHCTKLSVLKAYSLQIFLPRNWMWYLMWWPSSQMNLVLIWVQSFKKLNSKQTHLKILVFTILFLREVNLSRSIWMMIYSIGNKISLFPVLQWNLNAPPLYKIIVKSAMQSIQLCWKLPPYLLSTSTNILELVRPPTLSSPKKYHFSFISGFKLYNI